ncbi:tripartite tricarboxylate transporter permease [Janibacter sp. GS2]|uniref:tripartite tricarboxylate transporter permease n=1 Tax=Janibacter sp. GS2 TaxID=3442646 RepID=UPI003EB83B22
MSAFADLWGGLATVLTPENLFFAFLGVLLGTAVGILPGIGPAVTIALLLPVATELGGPTSALIMFAGIYYGAMYGGSTTSILLNTPGESASVATAIEGNLMAKNGQARAALATAAIGSFVAAVISTFLLVLIAKPAAELATTVQASTYVALMLLALMTVTALVGKSVIRGLCSLTLGMAIAMIGIDPQAASPRLTFGKIDLLGGIDVVLVVIGLFAIGETLYVLGKGRTKPGHMTPLGVSEGGFLWLTREQWGRSWGPWLRGAGVGFPFGALPSGGAELPTFMSFAYEKNRSKGRKEFGKGAIEGVAGPEAANNASFSGVLVPLLTLGLPTSATAAIMIAAFKQFNIQPGPRLFETSGDLVWALIASLLVGNIMLLVLNLPLIRLWVKVLEIPRPVLYAGILVFAVLGIYATTGNRTLILIALAIGILGYAMRQFDFPLAPAILGVILAKEMEAQFRRALTSSQGDLSIFYTRPMTVAILILALLALVLPLLPQLIARIRGRAPAEKLGFGEED